MGFSVSGSFAVIAVGAFIAFGMFYGAAGNATERVTDAQQAAFEDRLEQQNTDIAIVTAVYNQSAGNETLYVEVENTGAATLSTDGTDLLTDGVYNTSYQTSYVITSEGNQVATTTVWAPGETYHIEVSANAPDRIKVVTDPGVADTQTVEVVS